jgi:PKD repeat protein
MVRRLQQTVPRADNHRRMRIDRVWFRTAARLASDEAGFSVIEAMVAAFVLAVGAFAVIQAIGFGLTETGLTRQRQSAESIMNQEIELARGLNYSNVGLAETPELLPKSTDTSNPDYWISSDGTQYDPDGTGTDFGYEELITNQAAPNLPHGPQTLTKSHTTFKVYDYVTWVDLTGLSGVQDAKRLTVVVTWTGVDTHTTRHVSANTLFSSGVIAVSDGGSSSNNPPLVSCPTSTTTGLTADFTAVASDPDSGDAITQYDWDFGDGTTSSTTSPQATHTYDATGTYTVVVNVHDTHSAQASTASLSCSVTVTAPTPTPTGPDTGPPTGSIVINSGDTYSRSTQLTLTISATDDVGVTTMAFTTDPANFGSSMPYSAAAQYTVPVGDGVKTVYARFTDDAGNVSTVVSDDIILDTVAPPAPTGLTAARDNNKKSTTLSWTAVSASDLAGYAVYRRTGTSGTSFVQVTCNFSYGLPTKCDDTGETNHISYTFYVVAIDLAGNLSSPSNQVQV